MLSTRNGRLKKETEIIKLTVLYNNTGFVSSTQPIIARTNQYDEQQQRASKKIILRSQTSVV